MTKENIFKNFIDDPLLIEKGYISLEKIEHLKFIDPTGVKLIEVIKMAITGIVDGDSDGVTSRKINQFLNK